MMYVTKYCYVVMLHITVSVLIEDAGSEASMTTSL